MTLVKKMIELTQQNDETEYRRTLNYFVQWCGSNYLILNEKKTNEIVFDHRKRQNVVISPVILQNSVIEIVPKYKYLGVVIDEKLNWVEQSKHVLAKGHVRLHFLRKLKSFHVDKTILKLFYTTVIESTILYGCLSWYCS